MRLQTSISFEGKEITDKFRHRGEPVTFDTAKLHLSSISLQKEDSSWIAFEKGQLSTSEIPDGIYKAIRFTTRFHLKGSSSTPFHYHLGDAPHPPQVLVASHFRVHADTELHLNLELTRLLGFPRPISFSKDGGQMTSSLQAALIANSHSAFSLSAPQKESQILPRLLPAKHTPIVLKNDPRFPTPALPPSNPLTQERATIGENLLFDGVLSADGSVTCVACHDENNAFSDPRAISRGFEGRFGMNNSMPLFNLAWKSSFFWNGRANSVREQVLKPIEAHSEMAVSLDRVLYRMNRRRNYRQNFEKAFGPGEITREKLGMALENYLLTIVSQDSKFDQAMAGKTTLTKKEQRGMDLFFNDHVPGKSVGAGCFHCHGGANFTDQQFHNNGIFSPKDHGRQAITGKKEDRTKFITPSLRNIALTKPYTHDGRLLDLEEMIAHYSDPPHLSETLDLRLPKKGLQLSNVDKAALIAFLETLTDPRF